VLLRGRLPASDLHAIQKVLANSRMPDGSRAALLFGLAQVHDGRGAPAEAAACLAQANALALQENRRRGRPYLPAEHERYVDQLIGTFDPELFRRFAGAGVPTERPVFVFGMPRSGTTLVEQVLASHACVLGAGELRLTRQTFDSIPAESGTNEMAAAFRHLDAAQVRELARKQLDALEALGGRQRQGPVAPLRIVDKMPDNYLYLGLLALLFPQATFIHVRRDLRDVALSCWMTNFRSIRWANDFEHLAGRIRQYRRVMAHWRTVLPAPIHEVVYEHLVDDFEAEARRLVSACGLEWDPACLEFHRTARPVRTASVSQVRQPLYRKSVARWEPYREALAELFGLLP
jgi:hypothetical protein